MKKINKKCVILSLVISLFFLCSIVLILEANYKKTISIAINNNSNYHKYKISSVRVGETFYPLELFVNDNVEYKDGYLIVNGKDYDFSIDMSVVDNVFIQFITDDKSADIVLSEKSKLIEKSVDYSLSNSDNSVESFYSNITLKEILIDSLHNITVLGFFMYSLIYLVEFIIVYFILKFILYILNKQTKSDLSFKDILVFIISIFYLFLSCFYILLELFNILLIIPFFILGIYVYRRYKPCSIQNLFLLCATFFGIMMMFLLPPFHVPDEQAHFYKSYKTSYMNSRFLVIQDKGTEKARMYVSSNVANLTWEYMIDIHSEAYTLSAKNYFSNFTEFFNEKDPQRSLIFSGNTETLNPFCYIPSAICILICRILNSPVILCLLMCRFLNFSIFIFSGYYCLKKICMFKNSLFIVMLLPICLQQAAAVNQDSVMNSLIFIIITCLINFIHKDDKIINFRDILLFAFLGLCLSFCKFTYFPILFLIFLVPKDKFKLPKYSILFKIMVLLPNVLLTFISMFKKSNGLLVVGMYKISDVLASPLFFIKMYIRTFVGRVESDILLNLVNGFGWSTVWHINLFLFIIEVIFVVFYLTSNNDEATKKIVPLKNRIFSFVVCIIVVVLVYTSLLIACTYNSSLVIMGLQSRYFIPIIFLVLYIFTNNLVVLNFKDRKPIYFYCLLLIYSFVMFTLIYGYYV